jgi:uncharacterized membrane protein
MSPRVPAIRSLAFLALLTFLVGVALASAAGVGAAQTETPANGTIVAEETVIEIQLQGDGDARWHVTEHFALTDTAERAAFDELGESFEGRTAGSLGLDTFRRAVQAADAETNRSMRIQDVAYDVDRENASLDSVRALNGTMSVSFTWTNFAREAEDSFVVDDAFSTGSRTWFTGLTDDQRLIIALPQGHGASSAPKGFEENELRWEGPTRFEPGYMHIVYSGDLPPPNPPNGPSALVWAALGVTLLALLAAGVLLARRRGAELEKVFGSSEGDADDAAQPADDGDGESTPAEDQAGEDLELLSDEERVERLLSENGGRMKQANIVKETGWSNAKVSQLLSGMEDEGQIQKLRIGRENLITFPDEDVGEFES